MILPIEGGMKKNNTEAFIQRFAGSMHDFPEVESLLVTHNTREFIRVPDWLLADWL
ncbi:MAG: hypothetical protein ACKN9F_08635 [Methylomonas sp.]